VAFRESAWRDLFRKQSRFNNVSIISIIMMLLVHTFFPNAPFNLVKKSNKYLDYVSGDKRRGSAHARGFRSEIKHAAGFLQHALSDVPNALAGTKSTDGGKSALQAVHPKVTNGLKVTR
jgi:hypothetical protein